MKFENRALIWGILISSGGALSLANDNMWWSRAGAFIAGFALAMFIMEFVIDVIREKPNA